MSTVEIGKIGEKKVVEWLLANGYTIVEWDTKAPGATDIEAKNTKAHVLVQVKTAVEPNTPADMSHEEVQALKARASRKKAEAWQAKVQLDSKHNLKGEIQWKKL